MSSSSCGKKDAKAGRNWGSQVLFDPYSDENSGTTYTIDDDSLIKDMNELIDASEIIQLIWIYKCPLSCLQLTQLFLNHQFVVLKTKHWWWSIEKNDKHILIQRSKEISWVRNFVNQSARRTPVRQLSYGKGQKSMKELIEFLYKKNELNKKYDLLDDNCKDFAKRVFEEFAET